MSSHRNRTQAEHSHLSPLAPQYPPEFRAAARELIESHVGPVADDAIKSNLSSKGSFVSITVTVIATSQQQLDDIYRDVSAHDDVLMAL